MDRFGYYLPFAVASLVFSSVGTGLVSSFKVDTSADKWIGYQILLGFGTGLGIQMVSTTWAVEYFFDQLAETDDENDAGTAHPRNPEYCWG